MKVTLDMEIRHLPRQAVSELGNILQINHAWKDVMGLIPEKLGQQSDKKITKYSSEEICLIAGECARDGRTGMEILIEEWGTSGQVRPKVSDLCQLLIEAKLERAATYLHTLVIGDSDVGEKESTAFEIVEGRTLSCMSANPNQSEIDTSSFEEDPTVPALPYRELLIAITSGKKIGQGAFGSVYKARLELGSINKVVAIKILSMTDDEECKEPMKKEKLFKTEVEVLSKCDHVNILKLEGYSRDLCSDNLGLVYEYMENGSLHDRLAQVSTPPMPWTLRLNISKGIAEGLVYLHTNFDPPLVHRDVKSPNVLLDENFTPKLGDFGIARLGAHGRSANTVINTTAVGTVMYMAPEALRGDVSVKMDTFSYAVVILELLTGLPFYDEESGDILSFVQGYEGDAIDLLDNSAGAWDTSIGQDMFEFAEICTKDKKERPNMIKALSLLEDILNKL